MEGREAWHNHQRDNSRKRNDTFLPANEPIDDDSRKPLLLMPGGWPPDCCSEGAPLLAVPGDSDISWLERLCGALHVREEISRREEAVVR